jgi:hypothetical protein
MQPSIRLKQVVFLDQAFTRTRSRSRPLPHLAALDEENLTFYVETINGSSEVDGAGVQLQAVSSFLSAGISRIAAVPRRHWVPFGDSIEPQESDASFLCCTQGEQLQVIGFPLGTSSGTPTPQHCFQCSIGAVIDFSFSGPFLAVLTGARELVLWEVETRHPHARLSFDGRPKFCCGLGGWAVVVATEEATYHVVPLLDAGQASTPSQPLEVAYPSLFSSESVPTAFALISSEILVLGLASGAVCAVDPADMRLRFASKDNHIGEVTFLTEYAKTNSFCSLSLGEVRFWDSDTFALRGRIVDSALCGVVGVGSLRNHLYFAMAQNEFITPDLNLESEETNEKGQVGGHDPFSPTKLIRTINELQSNIIVTTEIQSSLASTVHRLTEELREANETVVRLREKCNSLEHELSTAVRDAKDSPPESSRLELEYCLQRISELESRCQEPSFLHPGLVGGTSGYLVVPSDPAENAESKSMVLPGTLLNGTDDLLSQLHDGDTWHVLPRTIQDSILKLKELLRDFRVERTPSHPTLGVASVVSPGRRKERPLVHKCDKCEELRLELDEVRFSLQKETLLWKTQREKLETDLMVAQEKESSHRNWAHTISFALSEKQILLDEAQAFNTSLMATVDCLYLDRLAEVSVSGSQRTDAASSSNGVRDAPSPTPSGANSNSRPAGARVVSPAFESSPPSERESLRARPLPNEEATREHLRLLEYLLECGKQKGGQHHSSTLTASYALIKDKLGLEKANRYLLRALQGGAQSEHDAILALISCLCAMYH